MSNGYECSATACDKAVAWLVTRLGGGGTIAFCEDDFAPGVIYFLAADLGVDGGKLYAAVTRFVDREAAKAAKAQADGARAAHDQAAADADEADEARLEAERLAGTEDASVSGDGITVQRIEP